MTKIRTPFCLLVAWVLFGQTIGLATPKRSSPEASPSFKGTSLSGETKTKSDLIGQPTIIIVTPTRSAGQESKKWAQQLKQEIPKEIRIRDIMAIELPFFVSEETARQKAQEKIPQKYWDQTWLVTGEDLESALDISPESKEPYIFAIDQEGKIVNFEKGNVSQKKARRIINSLQSASRKKG